MPPSGLRDGPLPDDAAHAGFWRQQWQGLQAMLAALRPGVPRKPAGGAAKGVRLRG
jgi:hypothetical protein